MAAKRFLDEDFENDQPNEKRIRTSKPTFASVIGEAIMVNSLKNLCKALEPLLRRVVNEELENTLKTYTTSCIPKTPSHEIQALEPSSLKLTFSNKLSLPIFTGSKILDADGASLQILLVDTKGDRMGPTYNLPSSIKVEIIVLDGDFPSNGGNNWTSEEFDKNIVKERTGKRPLLAGDVLMVTLRDGIAAVGDIEFTDNSSWIRSRKFRIGARVAPGTCQAGFHIHEAITEAFIVKDHRGELYKKHYPPMLGDEVWRLEKIGKDGAFHKKLTNAQVNTVQDFLKLSIVDPPRLRGILGNGMSEKMWEATMKHARTCVMGNKHYIFRGTNYTITLNPICQIVDAAIDGNTYSTKELSSINRSQIQNLVKQAYANWLSLEEVAIGAETPLLTQGELVDHYCTHHQNMAKPLHQNGYSADRYIDIETLPPDFPYLERNNWQITASYRGGSSVQSAIRYGSFSESSSEGEFTPSSLA